MSGEPSEDSSAAFCAGEVRSHDFDRYATTLFADPARRRALLALYAFNNDIAHVRDHISQSLPGEIRLQWWIDTLNGSGHGGVEGHPIAAELLKAIEIFKLPLHDLLHMIEGYRFDLYDDPMPTADALEVYLAETTSPLFSLSARICGAMPVPDELIRHAGLAQGIVRMIGLLPRHAARRQLYLPQQLLEMNAVSTEDVFAGKATPQLRTVLTYLAREARGHLASALGSVSALPAETRPAFLPLVLLDRKLRNTEREDFDPFRQTHPSRLATLWTLWRASRGLKTR